MTQLKMNLNYIKIVSILYQTNIHLDATIISMNIVLIFDQYSE